MHRFERTTSVRYRRHRRIRARVRGTAARPRLSVFRSTKHLVAQVIDDATGQTIVAASDREVTTPPVDDASQRKVALARAVGQLIAERAKEKGVTSVVFDRGGYAYHGRVQAVAEGAREGGLTF